MPEHSPKIKIYAHRGAKKYAPENTIPAFERALEMGADGFELDTMLSADGIPVVIHDRSLSRTTNGYGFVDQTTADELVKLDAGAWFSKEFQNVRIPVLENVLELFGEQAEINIELKNFESPFNSLPLIVSELVNKFGLGDKIIFSSFIPFNLIRIRRIIPEAKVALLLEPDFLGKWFSSLPLKKVSPDFIHPHYSLCTQAYISKQHKIGRKVNSWTINDEETMKDMIRRGLDGIITDDPALTSVVRDE